LNSVQLLFKHHASERIFFELASNNLFLRGLNSKFSDEAVLQWAHQKETTVSETALLTPSNYPSQYGERCARIHIDMGYI